MDDGCNVSQHVMEA